MNLRVKFTIEIEGKQTDGWCDVYDGPPFRVHFHQVFHDIYLRDSVWTCNDQYTAPYAPAIAAKLLHTKTLFKWGLPADLRGLIFSSEYNMDSNILTLSIEDKGNPFTQYETQLEAAFAAKKIISTATIHLYHPRRLERYITKFKA